MNVEDNQETFGLPTDLEKANEVLREFNKFLQEENKRLKSLDNDRLREMARLQNENRNLKRQLEILENRPKGKRGRPKNQGGYESALLIETLQVLHEQNRDVPTVSEQEAAVIADGRIRERAAEMHGAGTPCELAYVSPAFQPSKEVVYQTFLKAKRDCLNTPLSSLFPNTSQQLKRGRKPKKGN